MLGSNPGPLQLVLWQSDALTTRLDLIRTRLDLIFTVFARTVITNLIRRREEGIQEGGMRGEGIGEGEFEGMCLSLT